MDERERLEQGRSSAASASAARIDVGEFAEALSTGVLRALDRRALDEPGFKRPWIWAGWIIGDDLGPLGPFGPAGPQGPGAGGGP
jgi:hypothetical protein